MIKKLIAYIITASVFITQTANAGIMADMNSMFMSNTTAATTFSTSDRMGVFGASVSMRTPIQSVNLVSFDPPRLTAGCGGIDLFGGSFSFINGAALVSLFRNIASNAAGLAFKAAIQLISPSLSKLMTEFQSLLQAMNNLGKNSCSMAHLIVDPAAKSISDAIDGDGNTGTVENNGCSDAADCLSTYLSGATNYLNTVGRFNPRSGNQAVKAIIASGASGILGMAGLSNANGSTDDSSNPNSLNVQILLSFIGYSIDGVPCNQANEDGASTSTTSPTGSIGSRIDCKAPAILSLDDMVHGGGVGSPRPDIPLRIYTCLNPNGTGNSSDTDQQPCTQMQTTTLDYQGIEGWVNNSLFGSNDGSAPTDTSIVGMVNSQTSGKFTSAQNQFQHQAGMPVVALMSKITDPNARLDIANMLKQPIINCVAAQMGMALYKSANLIQANNSYQLGDEVKRNIEHLRKDYLDKEKLCLNDRSRLRVMQMIDLAARLNSKAAQ